MTTPIFLPPSIMMTIHFNYHGYVSPLMRGRELKQTSTKMTDVKRHKIMLMLYVIVILMVAASIVVCVVHAHASSSKTNTIKITTYNPYRIRANLEIKCDHDWRTNRFVFHKFIDIPGKQNTVIRVPNNMKDCQVWPKIVW